jgi:hypothetical protein
MRGPSASSTGPPLANVGARNALAVGTLTAALSDADAHVRSSATWVEICSPTRRTSAKTTSRWHGAWRQAVTRSSSSTSHGDSPAVTVPRRPTKGANRRRGRPRTRDRHASNRPRTGGPMPAGLGGTQGGASLAEDGARLDPPRGEPAYEQAARAFRDLRSFFAARKE